MGKILKVQLAIKGDHKVTQTFRCPNCNTFVNKKEEDKTITCPNCNTVYNINK